jgi:CheY-like chemotaxis protein
MSEGTAPTQDDHQARLVAALGHDIRGPLHVLGLSLQNLRLRAQNTEDRDLVFAAETAFEEIASLTEDLVDALSLGAGGDVPHEEGIVLSNLMQDLERGFRRRAAQDGVDLRVFISRIYCVSDRRFLRRILTNLIGNALTHAGARRILVGARLRGYERLVLDVVDDGRGIAEDDLPFVFEEWFRGREARATNRRGQGLGLWTVKRLTQMLGGRVSVASKPGNGAHFTVDIPTYGERRALPVPRIASSGDVLANRLVAVLDDDEDVIQATRMSLEALGARVFASTDDLYFLARVTSEPQAPDLFLLDFNLRTSTVERVLGILRTKFGPALRAIIVTGHGADPRVKSLGVTYPVISKPVSERDLEKIVDVLLGRIVLSPTQFR